jgi:hypothetical protein
MVLTANGPKKPKESVVGPLVRTVRASWQPMDPARVSLPRPDIYLTRYDGG